MVTLTECTTVAISSSPSIVPVGLLMVMLAASAALVATVSNTGAFSAMVSKTV